MYRAEQANKHLDVISITSGTVGRTEARLRIGANQDSSFGWTFDTAAAVVWVGWDVDGKAASLLICDVEGNTSRIERLALQPIGDKNPDARNFASSDRDLFDGITFVFGDEIARDASRGGPPGGVEWLCSGDGYRAFDKKMRADAEGIILLPVIKRKSDR